VCVPSRQNFARAGYPRLQHIEVLPEPVSHEAGDASERVSLGFTARRGNGEVQARQSLSPAGHIPKARARAGRSELPALADDVGGDRLLMGVRPRSPKLEVERGYRA